MSKYWIRVIHNDNSISTIHIQFESEFPVEKRGMLLRVKKYSDTIKEILSYGIEEDADEDFENIEKCEVYEARR